MPRDVRQVLAQHCLPQQLRPDACRRAESLDALLAQWRAWRRGTHTLQEWQALPADLQPLLRHQCSELDDKSSLAKQLRGEAADAQNAWGFSRAGEPGLENANAHIQVRVARL
jgi:hypothetical protein